VCRLACSRLSSELLRDKTRGSVFSGRSNLQGERVSEVMKTGKLDMTVIFLAAPSILGDLVYCALH